MDNDNSRVRFEQIAASADDEIRLDEAALVIASETDAGTDINRGLASLDELASRFEKRHAQESRFGVPVPGLIDYIHEEEGFGGNVRDYYDPRNSYLNHVIDTRAGIPITLALVHIAIGERLGIPVCGINFPGHFLVRYGVSPHQLIVDPFSGRILSEPDCATLLRQIAGPRAVLQPAYFDRAGRKDILVRVLDNLKQIFWRDKAWDLSKLCIERQLLLKPDRDEFSVQLGAIHEMQGNLTLAQDIYAQVVQDSRDEQLRSMAGKRLLAMQGSSPTVH